ncbi:NAD-dependent epimerase/dehydratase family protein [Pseudomonadota bacterium]
MTGVVLLTGATGFVGRQVLRALGERNIFVRLVIREGSNISSKYSDTIEKIIRTRDLFAETVNWWVAACEGVDTIIHVAWYAESGSYLHSPKNLQCLVGTLNLAQAAVQARVRRFVGIGTCFEYDLSCGRLSVETPLKPNTTYAGTKLATYLALSQWLSVEKVEFSWCRLFYLYGEGEDERRLVPYIRSKVSAGEYANLSHGSQIRDFIDVRISGSMIVEVALSDFQGAVNICSGIPITVRQLAEQIADEYGRRDLLRFGARPHDPLDPACVVGVKAELEA